MLLASEVKAKALVQKIGFVRATNIVNSLCARIERRIERANEGMFVTFIDNSCVRKSEWETDLLYQLKLGLMLTDYDSPLKARARILERRKLRKLERAKLNA